MKYRSWCVPGPLQIYLPPSLASKRTFIQQVFLVTGQTVMLLFFPLIRGYLNTYFDHMVQGQSRSPAWIIVRVRIHEHGARARVRLRRPTYLWLRCHYQRLQLG